MVTYWLREVEVRAVCDESKWSSPCTQYYGFIEGRRVCAGDRLASRDGAVLAGIRSTRDAETAPERGSAPVQLSDRPSRHVGGHRRPAPKENHM